MSAILTKIFHLCQILAMVGHFFRENVRYADQSYCFGKWKIKFVTSVPTQKILSFGFNEANPLRFCASVP